MVSRRKLSAAQHRLALVIVGCVVALAGVDRGRSQAADSAQALPAESDAEAAESDANEASGGKKKGEAAIVTDSKATADRPPSEPPTSLLNIKTIYRVPVEGIIDLGMAPFISRVVDEAAETPDSAVLLDINTFGGRVDAAVLIRDALINSPVPTIAFINPRAISAGALISLACETIAMAPGGSIGAATPITGGGTEKPEAADEKTLSYMRTEMRTTADRRGRPGEIAAAMVDRDIEIEGVSEKGKVLTLTTKEALAVAIVEFEADSLDSALETLGVTEAAVLERRLTWAEKIARGISHPVVSSFLLSIGFLGILLELYQPGWGLPGTLGITALIVFFFGHHVVQLAGFEEILLFLLGVGLLLLELLVIPGFGVAGFAGLALMAYSVVMSLIGLDLDVSWNLGFVREALVIVAASLVMTSGFGYLLLRALPRTNVARRLVLEQTLAAETGFSSHGADEASHPPLGSQGTTLSELRPAGKIRVDGKRLDAVSEGGFIARGANVQIVSWRAGTAVVRPDSSSADAALDDDFDDFDNEAAT